MSKSIAKQLAELEGFTPKELRERWRELTGEEARSNNKEWLVKRIAWRIQELAEGGLTERARRRAAELANDADLRLKAPSTLEVVPEPQPVPKRVTKPAPVKGDKRLPPVGSVITREYKGAKIKVTVRANGLEYQGELYATLSAVAKAITGTHTNGFLFFKIGQYAGGAK